MPTVSKLTTMFVVVVIMATTINGCGGGSLPAGITTTSNMEYSIATDQNMNPNNIYNQTRSYTLGSLDNYHQEAGDFLYQPGSEYVGSSLDMTQASGTARSASDAGFNLYFTYIYYRGLDKPPYHPLTPCFNANIPHIHVTIKRSKSTPNENADYKFHIGKFYSTNQTCYILWESVKQTCYNTCTAGRQPSYSNQKEMIRTISYATLVGAAAGIVIFSNPAATAVGTVVAGVAVIVLASVPDGYIPVVQTYRVAGREVFDPNIIGSDVCRTILIQDNQTQQ